MDVDSIVVQGEWIRHAPHRSALVGRTADPTNGRWQRGAVVRGLYLADEPATAIAEWYRLLAELGLPPERSVPHDHHVWSIELELANLGDDARLAALGLSLPQPSRRTWPAYQDVGEHLWRAGWEGLLAPSAARPGSLVVCIFQAREWPPAGCQPTRAIEVSSVPPQPSGMTAERAALLPTRARLAHPTAGCPAQRNRRISEISARLESGGSFVIQTR